MAAEANWLLAAGFDYDVRYRAKPANERAAGSRMTHGGIMNTRTSFISKLLRNLRCAQRTAKSICLSCLTINININTNGNDSLSGT